jgi:hypothetical protein
MIEELIVGSRADRRLLRKPTAEIRDLSKLVPKLYDVSGGGVCSKTPTNYSGSLILALMNNADESRGLECGAESPVTILNEIDISIYNKELRRYTKTGFRAGQVIRKMGCGMDLGLVTSGPMSGLVVKAEESSVANNQMYAVRVLNDLPVGEGGSPDPADSAISHSLVNHKQLTSAYKKEVEKVVFENPNAHESDLIFSLCARLGIAVDRESFHITRWITPEKAIREEAAIREELFRDFEEALLGGR